MTPASGLLSRDGQGRVRRPLFAEQDDDDRRAARALMIRGIDRRCGRGSRRAAFELAQDAFKYSPGHFLG
ncbi:MAG TPA: hypothetical protein VJ464_22545 [Blastocatellia bacterium]|nr:hypothetical protein [Blastocatellia bacterium]